jgi:outer membrane protein
MTRQETVRLTLPVAVVALLVLATSAAAQTPMALTLEDAVSRGLEAAPRVQEARARAVAAAAVRDSRKALAGPTASLMSGYTRTNHVDEFAVPQPGGGTRVIFPDIPDNWRLRADVLFPIWTGGRTNALVDGAVAELAAAEADAAVVAADLALEISLAYWHVVTTRARLAVLEEGLTRTDAWVADVQARVEAGVSSPHEVVQAQAHRARQRVQRIQTAQAATIAERDLVRLTGLPAGQRLELTTPVDRTGPGTGGGDDVALAMAQRTERAALQARKAAFESAGRAAMAALQPQIATFAGVEPARPNSRFVPRTDQWHTSWDLGVAVTWSLWDGGRARADRAAAQAQASAVSYRLQEFDARLDVEITQRVLDLESGRAAVEASAEAVAAAAELHRVMRERFDAGVATSTDVLDAHIAWLEASLERTTLQAAQRVAEARLQRTLGSIVR